MRYYRFDDSNVHKFLVKIMNDKTVLASELKKLMKTPRSVNMIYQQLVTLGYPIGKKSFQPRGETNKVVIYYIKKYCPDCGRRIEAVKSLCKDCANIKFEEEVERTCQ